MVPWLRPVISSFNGIECASIGDYGVEGKAGIPFGKMSRRERRWLRNHERISDWRAADSTITTKRLRNAIACDRTVRVSYYKSAPAEG